MWQQMVYFSRDVKRMLGKYKIRILTVWLSRIFWGIFLYRLERGMYLTFGKAYGIIRVIFIPIFNLIEAYSNVDIHYKADIKGGIKILHPAVGIVVSGLSVIGKNITMTGGNVIGGRPGSVSGSIRIGDYCSMGANAVILGPVTLGDHVSVGASACVVKDCELDNVSLVGVPAKVYQKVVTTEPV